MSSTALARRSKTTWLERLIRFISPGWALSRMRSQAAARGFEAAGGGRRTSGWHRSSSDANAVNGPAIIKLRELSRELRRNNPWARRIVQIVRNHAIAWGITANAEDRSNIRAEHAQAIWDSWAGSTACDYDGRLDFAGLQGLVMETVVESGEALVVREAAATSDGLPIPVRLRVLEPDYLDVSRDLASGQGGGPVLSGIEFDDRGRRVGYWLFDNHPGGNQVLSRRTQSRFVPARDVAHVYRVERPGQVRGVPWMASIIAALHDLAEYEDAVLEQQKNAACFAGIIYAMEGANPRAGEGDPNNDRLEVMQPGSFNYLMPGEDIKFAQPPSTSGQDVFRAANLRRIANGVGILYEDLTGDYSGQNYSSSRQAKLTANANVYEWQDSMVIPQLCEPVWGWVMGMAAQLHGWPTVPQAQWNPPPPPMIDPAKEIEASTKEIRAGLVSHPAVLRRNGIDPQRMLDEQIAWLEKVDAAGLVFDSDARLVSLTGQKHKASSLNGLAKEDDEAEEGEGGKSEGDE